MDKKGEVMDHGDQLAAYAFVSTYMMKDGDTLSASSIIEAMKANNTEELMECPRCHLYTRLDDHWCGSVALVRRR